MMDKIVPNGVDHHRRSDGSRRSRCEDVDDVFQSTDADETSIGCCGWLLTLVSYILVVVSFPLSLCFCLKIVQVNCQLFDLFMLSVISIRRFIRR